MIFVWNLHSVSVQHWGKVPIFNGGDKHCVITPNNFCIPESISSHSTDFIIAVINTKILKSIISFKIWESSYCCTKLHVQNEPYHIVIVANTLKFLACVANSGWFNWNFSQFFLCIFFSCENFSLVLSNISWCPTIDGFTLLCKAVKHILARRNSYNFQWQLIATVSRLTCIFCTEIWQNCMKQMRIQSRTFDMNSKQCRSE